MKRKRLIQTLICLSLMLGVFCGCTPQKKNVTYPSLEIYDDNDTSRALGQTNQVHQAEYANITPIGSSVAKKNYTVMIYMVGSNLESRYGAASKDLQEITDSGVDFSKNNVLVYTGGSRRWSTDISSDYNSILDMSKASDRIVATTNRASDMGAPETLSNFVNYATEYYPAEHYGLILWDHGGGPLWGYGCDELFSYDSLMLEEIKKAMGDTIFQKDAKLDFIGYDACLMGSLESAKLWQAYSAYMVASEEVEAGAGWDYSFLKTLNGDVTTEDVVSAIVEQFGTYYKENQTSFSHPDATLAAMDLSRVDATIKAADGLFGKLNGHVAKDYNAISKLRAATKTFGLSAVEGKGQGYDLIDLGDFANILSKTYKTESAALTQALSEMVVASTSNVKNTHGVSIYFPADNKTLYKESIQISYKDIAISDTYMTFLNAYSNEWLGTTDVRWKLNEAKRQGNEYTIALSDAQQNAMTQAYYTVLHRDRNAYYLATYNVKVEVGQDGKLHIPSDPNVFISTNDEDGSTYPWIFAQTDMTDTTETYRGVTAYLLAVSDFTDLDLDVDKAVNIVIKKEKNKSDTEVVSVYESGTTNGGGGKNTLDASRYKALACYLFNYKLPAHNDDGSMSPFFDWDNGGIYGYFYHAFENEFAFKAVPVSEMKGDYYAQVTIRDVNGEVHGSDLIRLDEKKVTTRTQKTEKGEMTFTIENKQAILTKYEGTDTTLSIPAYVDDYPVTRIGSQICNRNEKTTSVILPETVKVLGARALSGMSALTSVKLNEGLEEIGTSALGCRTLTSVTLPESLRTIERGAFKYAGIKELTIPAKTTIIKSGAFIQMASLKAIHVSAGNTAVKDVDGVLYTKDGKTLLRYPNKKGTTYEVEKGTEIIDYGAFDNCEIESVTFPEGLKTIENAAFFGCTALKGVTLPESLETIGVKAFGCVELMRSYGKRPVIDQIKIGPNVSYIGERAFCNLDVENFEVDSRNPYYGSLGGFITNKAKDTIQEAPLGRKQVVEVPEGIVSLNRNVFHNYPGDMEFILPGSLYRFSTQIFNGTPKRNEETGRYDTIYHIVIHAPEGSAAIDYANRYNIKYDHQMQRKKLTYETYEETIDGATYTYRLYDDHAVMTACSLESVDKNWDVWTMPSIVQGKKITAIDVDSLGYFSGVKTLVLPDHLEKLNSDFFENMSWSIEAYQISEKNTSFVSEDGVLYAKDHKVLYGYPAAKTDETYTIREETETINDYAFYGQGYNSDFTHQTCLKHVIFPKTLKTVETHSFASSQVETIDWNEGLERVEDFAFYNSKLTSLQLPYSLQVIGNNAFSKVADYRALHLPEKLTTLGFSAFSPDDTSLVKKGKLHIPPSLKNIDLSAFKGMAFTAFDVDAANITYSGKGALLLAKNGKSVMRCAPGVKGTVSVPEGIETVESYAFVCSPQVTDIILPSSLTSFNSNAIDKKDGKYIARVHVKKGSQMARLLKNDGLDVIEE